MMFARNRLLWLILAIIGVTVALLVWNDRSGQTFGIDNDQFGQSVYLGVWGLVIAAGLLGARRRLGDVARSVALWLVIALVLVAGYQYRYELQDIGNRITAGLIPGSPIAVTSEKGHAGVVLDKLDNGHFGARATIDGTTVSMIVDTGATTTVLTESDAKRVGIHTGRLSFTVPVTTANGRTKAASAEVGEIRIGGIVRRHLDVLVAPSGSLDQSLLGMNFIGSLSGFEMRGDRMILRD